jgi:hypothetical protein
VAFSPKGFADDTDFERLVLDRLGTHRVRSSEPGAIHDIRGRESGGGSIIVKVGAAISGTQLREELRQSLRPLGFGAAYKVLDMLVEHVLRANGATASRLSFRLKTRALTNRPPNLLVPSQHAPGSVGSPCGPLRCFRRGEARRDAPTRAGHGDRCA